MPADGAGTARLADFMVRVHDAHYRLLHTCWGKCSREACPDGQVTRGRRASGIPPWFEAKARTTTCDTRRTR